MAVVRVAVVGRADSDFDALVAEALRRASGRPVDLTVVAVARRAVIDFAPLSGHVYVEQLQRPPIEAAARAARRAVLRLDAGVPARHLALARRSDLRRHPAATPWFDEVVLAGELAGRWPRWSARPGRRTAPRPPGSRRSPRRAPWPSS